jgi:hypothetical protein
MTVSEYLQKSPGSDKNRLKEDAMRYQDERHSLNLQRPRRVFSKACLEEYFFNTTLIINGAPAVTVHTIFDDVQRSLCSRNS